MSTYAKQRYEFVLAAVVLLIAGSVISRAAAPEVPTYKVPIFTTYFPKNGQGSYLTSGSSPGQVRNVAENLYEQWWREITYYRANVTNGINMRGFYMDTKTYDENVVPWPWNPGIAPTSQVSIVTDAGVSVSVLTNVYTGTLTPPPANGFLVTFAIGTARVTDQGGGLLGGDGSGWMNYSDGTYNFQMNVAVPAGLPIQASYTAYNMGAAPSPAGWANFDAVINDTGRRTPNGRGEQFNEGPGEVMRGQRYPRRNMDTGRPIYDPLQDGFWTPGERFTDMPRPDSRFPPNGMWDDYVHAEDRWTPTHSVSGIAQVVLATSLRNFLASNSVGDAFFDYDFSITSVGRGNVPTNVSRIYPQAVRVQTYDEFAGMVATNVTIWVADEDRQVNVPFQISEFDLTPPFYFNSSAASTNIHRYGEDWWRPYHIITNYCANRVLSGPLKNFIASSGVGDIIADYDSNLPAPPDTNTMITAFGVSTNLVIYVADVSGGTNVPFRINELDLTPPVWYTNVGGVLVAHYETALQATTNDPGAALEGDAYHMYQRDLTPGNTNTLYTNVAQLGRFEYQSLSGSPNVYLSPHRILVKTFLPEEDILYLMSYPNEDVGGFMYTNNRIVITSLSSGFLTDSGWLGFTAPVSAPNRVLTYVEIPTYYGKPVWGAPQDAVTYTNSAAVAGTENVFVDAVLNDDVWNPTTNITTVTYGNLTPNYRIDGSVRADNDPRVIEGDATHTYVRDNTNPPPNLRIMYTNVPPNNRFEYNIGRGGTGPAGLPHVYSLGQEVLIYTYLDLPITLYDTILNSGGIDVQGYTYSNTQVHVFDPPVGFLSRTGGDLADGNPLSDTNTYIRVEALVHVPLFFAWQLWGEPQSTNYLALPSSSTTNVPYIGIDNAFRDCIPSNAYDDVWTPALPAEPFNGFISYWKPTGGPGGSGYWVGGIFGVPGLGQVPPPPAEPTITWISYDEYAAYINNNYPGNTAVLLARLVNEIYDGPDDWVDVANNQIRQNGFDRLCSVPQYNVLSALFTYTMTPPLTLDTWWVQQFGNASPGWIGRWPIVAEWNPPLIDGQQNPATVSTNINAFGIEVVSTSYVAVVHPPPGSTWTYDSPREFQDMASSLYHNPDLGSSSAMQMRRLGIAFDYGGDMRFGEVTCSTHADWSIRGADHGDNNPYRRLTTPDFLIPASGPYALNIHGEHKFDAGSQVNIELMTWRTDGNSLTGPRGGHAKIAGYCYRAGGSEVPYAKDHRDVNLNGMIDQGETIPDLSHNYYIDADPTTPDNGMDTRALFGWERFVEDCIESWDSMEDMSTLARFNNQIPSEFQVYSPSYFGWSDGAAANGILDVRYYDRNNDLAFSRGYDSAWFDENSNGIYDADTILCNPAILTTPTNTGFATTSSWANVNGKAGFQVSDLVWLDTMVANGIFDSEPVLMSSRFLRPDDPGIAFPAGMKIFVWSANVWSTNTPPTPPAAPFEMMWVVTNTAYAASSNMFGTEPYIVLLNSTYKSPGTNCIGVQYSGTALEATYGQVRFVDRVGDFLMYQPGDDVFIDSNGDGRYTGEPVVSAPFDLVAFNWTTNQWGLGVCPGFPLGSLAQSNTISIAHTTNVMPGVFVRNVDAAWRDVALPNDFYNDEPVLVSAITLQNGMTGLVDNTHFRWIDVAPEGGMLNGVYDPPSVLAGVGPEGSDVLQGDALFYDGNLNNVYDLIFDTALPVYVVALYNQSGVAAPGILQSGQGYSSPTRDGFIMSGFNQCQPVAINMPVPGILTHEQAHDVFGWPDLYDYDVSSGDFVNTPCGGYDLMASGNYVHGYPSLKFRTEYGATRGVIPTELNMPNSYYPTTVLRKGAGPKTILLYPIERVADQYYVFRNERNPNEYYTIYYNAANLVGAGNPLNEQPSPYANAIGRGIVITHTDNGVPDGYYLQQRAHPRWYVVQADGLYEMDVGASVSPPDAFGLSPTTKQFTPETTPRSEWWDETDTGLRIYDMILDPTNPYAPAQVVLEWVDPSGTGVVSGWVGSDWYWVAPGASADVDADGIPDAWEMYWFNRYPNPLAMANQFTDYDGDGLPDLAEYLARGNPTWQTSWTNGLTNEVVVDAFFDLDRDGLSNIQEFRDYGTDMLDPDTDDDGITDGDELNWTVVKQDGRRITNPLYSRSPMVGRALRLTTNDMFLVPEQIVGGWTRLNLSNWTVEAWVYLDTDNESGFIVSRPTVQNGFTFSLGVVSNVPFVGFLQFNGAGEQLFWDAAIPPSNWVHVAGVFDPGNETLRLFVDGEIKAMTTMLNGDPNMPPMIGGSTGGGSTYVGGGINGIVDEVRIWSRPRTHNEIYYTMDKIINSPWVRTSTYIGESFGNDGSLVVNLRFDDCTTNMFRTVWGMISYGAEDFTHLTNWNYAVRWNAGADRVVLQSDFVTNAAVLRLSLVEADPIDDLNEDRIADWWQQVYWRNFNPFVSGPWAADNDPDNDSMINYIEYILDTNPKAMDTEDDSWSGGRNDADDDGLSNGDEIDLYGTDPRNADTDDDGVSDGQEILDFTNPLYSRSPQVLRSMVLDGTRKYKMPEGMSLASYRFSLETWTVEFWVKLDNDNTTGSLVSRPLAGPQNGLINWAVVVDDNVPYTYFHTEAGRVVLAGGGAPLPTNRWVHLASVFDPARDTLELMVDGVVFTAQATLERPAIGLGQAYIGDIGVTGLVDEIRIWNRARTQDEIVAFRNEFMPWTDTNVLAQAQTQRALVERIRLNPGRFQEFGGMIYEFINTPLSYTNAAAYAAAMGGRLASINSGAENAFVAEMVGTNATAVWIGLSDAATEGAWTWEDGTTPIYNNYSNWETRILVVGGVTNTITEPDGGVLQNYTIMGLQNFPSNSIEVGGWYDVLEGAANAFVIEYDTAIDGLMAWYVFDDGTTNTIRCGAEDFIHLLDWRFAIKNVMFTDNDHADIAGFEDLDLDTLPDWWERLWFGDLAPTPDADSDKDGLNNRYEYFAVTNPDDKDTDNDGVYDGYEDADGDGLINSEEQRFGSHPLLRDTDDDGVNDGAEVDAHGDPASSIMQLTARALNPAGGYVEMPLDTRFALKDWTIEAWVQPTAGGGNIIERSVSPTEQNFRLWLNGAVPTISFNGTTLVGPAITVDGSQWTHIAVTYNSGPKTLKMYYATSTAATPVIITNAVASLDVTVTNAPTPYGLGPIVQRIGEGFTGLIEEVRIWDYALSAQTVADYVPVWLDGDEHGLVAYYRFDDSTAVGGVSENAEWQRGQVEDFVTAYSRDWWQEWRHAATTVGGATFTTLTALTSPVPIPVDSDGDGLPDSFENLYSSCLDANNPDTDDDGILDGSDNDDGDGMTNYEEYRAGTDPCLREVLTSTPASPLSIQVGDTLTVTLTRPDWATSDVFNAACVVSDPTLLSVNVTTVTMASGVPTNVINITALATAEGLGVQDGWVQIIGGDGSVLKLQVFVHKGVALVLNLDPPTQTNVVVGDTTTFRVTRMRDPSGLIGLPLTLNILSSDPNRLSVPATVTLPGGVDTVAFPITGLCETGTNGVYVSVMAAGYPGSNVLLEVVAPRYLTIADAITTAGDNGITPGNVVIRPNEVRTLTIYRPHDQQGAALVLNMASGDVNVFTVAPATVTIPAGQQGAQFTVTGVAGGTNSVFALACGLPVAEASISVEAAIVLSGGDEVVLGDIETFTMNLDVSANLTTNITVMLEGADANSMAAVRFVNPLTLESISSVTVSGGQSRATFAVEGLKLCDNVNIRAYAPGWAFTVGTLTFDVVPPTLTFDQAFYNVEISNSCPFELTRGDGEAGGSLTVTLPSSTNDVFTVPGSLTFAPGENSVRGLIYGGNGGGPVSNDHLCAVLDRVTGESVTNTFADVNLVPKVPRLLRMRWYDTDKSLTYTLGDRLELIFNTVMSNQTVVAANLMFCMEVAGDWTNSGLNATYFLGSGYTPLAVSNNSAIYTYSDSHYFVTLGSSPHAYYTYGVDPTNTVRAANGDPDATWPPVRFPRYAQGEDGDGDGMPSDWEEENGLDPDDGTGDNGFFGDPDRDGLINGYEFLGTKQFEPDTLSLLNPRSFDSDGDGIGDYDSRYAMCQLRYGEIFDDADMLPDWWEAENQIVGSVPTTLSTTLFSAYDDEDLDGWINLDEFLYQGVSSNGLPIRGTDPADAASFPEPKITGLLVYDGAAAGEYHVIAYGTPNMDGAPLSEATVSNVGRTVQFELTGLKSGDIYIFAYKGGATYVPGAPWGVPDRNPIKVTWSGAERVMIGINDPTDRPYYPAFTWPQLANVPKYYLRFYKGTTQILQSEIRAPRNWFFFRDYQTATYSSGNSYYGLSSGTYTYQVYTNATYSGVIAAQGTVVVTGPAVTVPTPINPVGAGVIQNTVVDFVVSNSQPIAALDIRLTLPSATVTNFTFVPTWRTLDGTHTVRLPVLFGEGVYTNGQYQWDVRAYNGATWTTYSSPKQTFTLDIGAETRGAPALGGVVKYSGRVATNLVIEAFLTPGFSGTPLARYTKTSPSATNGFVLQGLQHAVYYVRAYFDSNTNRSPDTWESQAFARDPSYGENFEYWDSYAIGSFDLTDRQSLSNVVIVIRDRDTDEDRMPDAWEMKYFGTLGRDGGDDFESDGLSDLAEYKCGSNPRVSDTDGDGLNDADEVNGVPYRTDPASMDTDGDGLTDREELTGVNDARTPATPAGTSNPTDSDTDNDGIPDGSDPSPTAPAADNDGVPTWVEIAWDGNAATYNPYNRTANPTGTDLSADRADTDGDGISDLEEIAAGSNPINPGSSNTVKIAEWRMEGGEMKVVWDVFGNIASIPVTFHVEATTNMVDWIEVNESPYVSDGVHDVTVTFTHAPLGTPIVSYRLRVTID